MPKQRVFDDQRYAHFVTFSCYHRRRLLDHDQAKQITLTVLAEELNKQTGTCVGYVIMPDHVHTIVWFPATDQLSTFLKHWKQRSSAQIKELFRSRLVEYVSTIDLKQPVWQRKFYAYNLFTASKMKEKLDYMHLNPVRAGLTSKAVDWRWSSARYYELLEPVDVPVRWVEERVVESGAPLVPSAPRRLRRLGHPPNPFVLQPPACYTSIASIRSRVTG